MSVLKRAKYKERKGCIKFIGKFFGNNTLRKVWEETVNGDGEGKDQYDNSDTNENMINSNDDVDNVKDDNDDDEKETKRN